MFFVEVERTYLQIVNITPQLLENLLQCEDLFLFVGRKVHWVSVSFGSIISQHLFPKHLEYILQGEVSLTMLQ